MFMVYFYCNIFDWNKICSFRC